MNILLSPLAMTCTIHEHAAMGGSSDGVTAACMADVIAGFLAAPAGGRHSSSSNLVALVLESFDRQRGINAYKTAKKVVEADAMRVVQEHLDSVSVILVSQLGLFYPKYQKLINATSWESTNGTVTRVTCPLGTPMARWQPKNNVAAMIARRAAELGLQTLANSGASLNPRTVLVDLIPRMVAEQSIDLDEDGATIWVQVLGDAAGIWRSLKMNGTTLVLKLCYVTRGAGAHLRGFPVKQSSKHNVVAFGFYLGDDCLSDMKEHMPHIPDILADIQKNGLNISGRHLKIKLWMGGDLKFLTAMLAISGNQTIFPCPFCLVCDCKTLKQLHLFMEQLKKAGVQARTIEMIQKHAHHHARDEDFDCSLCKKTKNGPWPVPVRADTPPLVFANDNQRRDWSQCHFSVMANESPFFYCIPVARFIADGLHVELRLEPKVWQYTVAGYCDEAQLADICQWVFDTQRVWISKETAVQNKKGDVNIMGTDSWPGKTCRRLVICHEDVLDQVHAQTDEEEKSICYQVWIEYICYLHELKYGCPVDLPEHWPGHAKRLKLRAEAFLSVYKIIAGADNFTVYMHVLLAEIPRMVLAFGSLVKGSSQRTEALHVATKHFGHHGCNKHENEAATQILTKHVASGMGQDQASIQIRSGRGGEQVHRHGGYLAKAEREKLHRVMQKALAKSKAQIPSS